MKLTFIYFNFPFWRVEVSRIALYFGGVEFDTIVIDREEFAAVKLNGALNDGTVIPFHQFPCLIVDGTPICQTGAIARFCGKLSGFYPADDLLMAAQTDQFLDIATDITDLVIFAGRGQDPATVIKERQQLAKDGLHRKLSILDKLIGADHDWIFGGKIGLADVAIWRMSGWLSSGLDGIPSEILSPFPNILRICNNVEEHPQIISWVKKTYPEGYNRGAFAI